jgi:regulator of cell morphogenesis and NO signaling
MSHIQLNTDIKNWPLDLLVDYVLKIYHRSAREMMPEITALLNEVIENDSTTNPNLMKINDLFIASVSDLDIHFQKEENVLFPFILEMYDAVNEGRQPEPIHCGTISHPISVMMSDHAGEADRYEVISRLTNSYAVPSDGSQQHRLLIKQLKSFHDMLLQHIHLENEIIFPRATAFESKYINM